MRTIFMKSSYYDLLKSFLIVFVTFLILFFGITTFVLFQKSKAQKEVLMAKEIQTIEKLRRIANDNIKSVISDLFFLSVHPNLHQMLENDNPTLREKLVKDVKSFSNNSTRYDQIRFLDETGMEKIRINFNQINSVVVSEDKLQNKAKRYYFTDTFALEPGLIFVSPFDLNIEHGQIEQPLKPIIRFGTPVVDLAGQKRGIVLLNFFGQQLIQNLIQAVSESSNSFELLNSKGYWLSGKIPEDEWGFMYENSKDRTLASRYPEIWEKISDQDEGQFTNDQGIYTFATIWPLVNGMLSSSGSSNAFQASSSGLLRENYFWKIVLLVNNDKLAVLKTEILCKWLPYLSAILILLIVFSLAVSIAMLQRKHALDAKLQKEKLEGVLEMAGAVCHELNQPLMSISGFSQLLSDDLTDDNIQKENLTEIQNQVERLGKITNRLMTITKYKTKKYLKGNIIDIEAASDDK